MTILSEVQLMHQNLMQHTSVPAVCLEEALGLNGFNYVTTSIWLSLGNSYNNITLHLVCFCDWLFTQPQMTVVQKMKEYVVLGFSEVRYVFIQVNKRKPDTGLVQGFS